MQEKITICGGGGFIGSHLVRDLKQCGLWVRVVDLKFPEFSPSPADEYILGDLRDPAVARQATTEATTVYQLAADMGGMGYIAGGHDAVIMHNSALINLNVLEAARRARVSTIFYSSTACVYPRSHQEDPDSPKCSEDSVYPANPDTEYGWEKLFSERLYFTYLRDYGLKVKVARFHNIFGTECTWQGGREKAPAALCRKIAEVNDGGTVEVWSDGDQTRSFLYIDECLEGMRRLMASDFSGPLNIGSEELITINDLAHMIADIAGKKIQIRNVPGPQGVRGRVSDNTLIRQELGWSPSATLRDGLTTTYRWIESQLRMRQTEKSLNGMRTTVPA